MNISASIALSRAEQSFRAGRHDEAARLVIGHLRGQPQDPRALSLLGAIATETGALSQGENFYRRALAMQPGSPEIRMNLARNLNQQSRVAEALELFETLRSDGDSSTEVILSLLYDKLGRHDESRSVLEAAKERYPDKPNIWLAWGHNLRYAGKTDEALAAYRRAIAIQPDLGEAWWGMASIKRKVFEPAELAAMQESADEAVDVNNEAPLRFALGRAMAVEYRHEEAFRQYERANAIWAENLNYDAGQLSREVAQSEQLFTADTIARMTGGAQSDAPIFIVSLPRSGSTLLEQMLGSHPDIEPLGELPHIPALLRTLMEGATRAGIRAVPEAVAKMSDADAKGMGEEYLRRVAPHRRSDKRWFLDKMPHNWSNALLLRRILPNAHVVDIRRDAMTCCWSNFSHSFSQAHASSFTLEGIGQAYVDYVRLMAHLDRIAPGWIAHVAYDELIERPEPVLRALFDQLGIPFDEAVLRFYESKREVRTPSAEQVRKPLNREGVGTWKPYERWLDPLKAVLGDLAKG